MSEAKNAAPPCVWWNYDLEGAPRCRKKHCLSCPPLRKNGTPWKRCLSYKPAPHELRVSKGENR